MSRTPPNGSRERPRLIRNDWSMAHIMSERTIETSSMTSSLRRRMTPPLRERLMSSGRISRGGRPKKEWIVWPPTLTAASPVGASTATSSVMRSRSPRRSVDLPVPARPVTKRCPSRARRKSSAASYSAVGVVPAGQLLGSEPAIPATACLRWERILDKKNSLAGWRYAHSYQRFYGNIRRLPVRTGRRKKCGPPF